MILCGGVVLNVEVKTEKGFNAKISDANFIEAVVQDTSIPLSGVVGGISIPMLQLKIKAHQQKQSIEIIRGGKTTVTFGWGQDTNSVINRTYIVVNSKSIVVHDSATLFLYCMLDTGSFITKSEQGVFKGKTSIEAIKECSELEVQDEIEGSPSDTMTWLRANKTQRAFIEETIFHSNLSGDVIIPAVVASKEGKPTLRLTSYKYTGSAKPVCTFTIDPSVNSEIPRIVANKISIEANNGVADYLFSGESDLNIIKLPYQEKEEKPLKKIPKTERIFENTTPYPTMIDCSNTHNAWHQSLIENQRAFEDIRRNIAVIEYKDQFNPELKPLDVIDLKGQKFGDDMGFGGNYVILAIDSFVTKKGIDQRVVACSATIKR